MDCFFSGRPAGLLLALPIVAALVAYIARRRRSSTHAVSTPDLEALDEKEPVVTEVELVAEKSKHALHAEKWVPPNHFDGNPWLVRILAEADASKAELHPVLPRSLVATSMTQSREAWPFGYTSFTNCCEPGSTVRFFRSPVSAEGLMVESGLLK